MVLVVCPSCARHLRDSETTCPFCRAPRIASWLTASAMLAIVACSSAAVYGGPPPGPSDRPAEPAQPSQRPSAAVVVPTHVVAVHESVVLDTDTTLQVEGFVVEEIAASPDNPDAYPAGSGIVVSIVATRGTEVQRASLSLLSAGYDSASAAVVHGHRITLVGVDEPHGAARVSLLIERVAPPP